MSHPISRRAFTVTSVATVTSLLAARTSAAELSPQEQANVKLVDDFCAAFATKNIGRVLAFASDTVVYRMTETTPAVSGHEGISGRLKAYLDDSDTVDFKVLESYAKGPMVINHRIDTFASRTRPLIWEGVGVFFVKGGKIQEWHDYTIKVTR